MLVRRITKNSGVDAVAFFGDRVFVVNIRIVVQQTVDVRSYRHSLGITPWALPNAVNCIYSGLSLGFLSTQIGAPLAMTSSDGLSEILAVGIGASEATQVSALAEPNTSDKETQWQWFRHSWRTPTLLCVRRINQKEVSYGG
jgi:hypothetical protein